eukprot:TRINITY_DN41736_c0_g7_i1.p1 TRINITY_DN41736_c0_g7~~TRINITY_DN41736_c0_g7_i1.p1  ORF type:complete len:962 (+),score=382.89 TRINITY_DN41736_c0_g7_i1:164-3049(+)
MGGSSSKGGGAGHTGRSKYAPKQTLVEEFSKEQIEQLEESKSRAGMGSSGPEVPQGDAAPTRRDALQARMAHRQMMSEGGVQGAVYVAAPARSSAASGSGFRAYDPKRAQEIEDDDVLPTDALSALEACKALAKAKSKPKPERLKDREVGLPGQAAEPQPTRGGGEDDTGRVSQPPDQQPQRERVRGPLKVGPAAPPLLDPGVGLIGSSSSSTNKPRFIPPGKGPDDFAARHRRKAFPKHVDVSVSTRKVLLQWARYGKKWMKAKREREAAERAARPKARRRKPKNRARVDRVIAMYMDNQEELDRMCLREPGMLIKTQLKLMDRRIATLSDDVEEIEPEGEMPFEARGGARVRLHGLKSAPELNGMEGTCEWFDSDRGRWVVRLSDGQERSIKPDNLEVMVNTSKSRKRPTPLEVVQLPPKKPKEFMMPQSWEQVFDRAVEKRYGWKGERDRIQYEAEQEASKRWLFERLKIEDEEKQKAEAIAIAKAELLAQLELERERLKQLLPIYDSRLRRLKEQELVDAGEALKEEEIEAENAMAEALREQRKYEKEQQRINEANLRRRLEKEEQLRREKEEAERLRREEAEREMEEERRRLEEEEERQREEAQRRYEEELERLRQDQEERRQREEEERLRKEDEERLRREEEEQRRKEEEEERRRQEEEKRRLVEEARRKREQEEEERRQREEEERRLLEKLEEERRKKAEEKLRLQKEEEKRQRQAEEEERRRQEEMDRLQEEEEERQRKEFEEAQRAAEAADREKKEAEARKRREAEEERLRQEEEERQRRLEEERKKQEEELQRRLQEQLRVLAEQQAERERLAKLQEEEDAKNAETKALEARAKERQARRAAWRDRAFDALEMACDEEENEEGEGEDDQKADTEASATTAPSSGADWMSRALGALGDEDEESSEEEEEDDEGEEGDEDPDSGGRADDADVQLLRMTLAIAERIGDLHGKKG